MTFLCEYNVNTASPWNLKTKKKKIKNKISQKTSVPLQNNFPAAPKNKKDIIEKIKKDEIDMEINEIDPNSIETRVEGKDNSIEVIANKDSSVVIIKKDAFKRSEKLVGDNVSWSIFEMLKNVIKMPFQRSVS